MTTVVIADDNDLIREGISALLSAEPDLNVVGTAADGAEAIGLIGSLQPDVALMDIQMPHLNGIEATQRLVSSGAKTRVLILTTFGADQNVLAALRAGASGFLLKDSPRAALVAAVHAVASGDATLDDTVLRRLVTGHLANGDQSAPSLRRLSPREMEVFKLVGSGATNEEVAHTLFISQTTVKTHISRIQAKLGARDRIQLVVIANRAQSPTTQNTER